MNLIDQIHKEEGTTTLIIEHRLEDVLHRPVDRIVLINDGRILFNGSPDQLLATDLLTQNGIREPLYLTTLRQLGVDLVKEEQLADLDNLPNLKRSGSVADGTSKRDARIAVTL